jgi:hypothetical protein
MEGVKRQYYVTHRQVRFSFCAGMCLAREWISDQILALVVWIKLVSGNPRKEGRIGM